jgi:hypothetical protein
MVAELLATAMEAEPETVAVAEVPAPALYVPGLWHCPQCKFECSKAIISVTAGDVFVDNREHAENCPNDGTPMVRMTWEEHARGLEKAIDGWVQRTVAAEKALELQAGGAGGLVLTERARQIALKGWDATHDDMYNPGTLATAGRVYASVAATMITTRRPLPECFTPKDWPWAPETFKRTGPLTMLVKGAALILAELDKALRAGWQPGAAYAETGDGQTFEAKGDSAK